MDKLAASSKNTQSKCIVCGSERLKHFSRYNTAKETEGIFIGRRLVRCQSCSHIQIEPMFTEDELDQYYSQSKYWSEKHSDDRTHKLQSKAFSQIAYIESKTSLNDIERVLDIGAGYGRFFQELRALLPEREFKFTAVEGGPDAVTYLKETFDAKIHKSYKAVKGKFDLIVISHFMEHMSNPSELMRLISRSLTSSGVCFIEVPNKDYAYRKNLTPHISFFSPESLTHCSTNNGLKVVDITTAGTPLILLDRSNAPHIRLLRAAARFYEKILIGRLDQQYNEIFLNTLIKRSKMTERSTAVAGRDRYRLQALLKL
ncbi:MAG: class I SAM-dependent methyltransferase [Nitrospirae bacterium]|nr:class I SAM-dependent methyltransferase [Nitrospirota bacterium]